MITRRDGASESADERRTRELLGTLRADVRAPAELRAAVLREITRPRQPFWARTLAWWLRPHPVRVRPALAGLALVAVVAIVAVLPGPGRPADDAAATGESRVVTRFVLVAPEAASVRLTGDFASWSPRGIELEDLRGTGIWTADVPLPPGVYQYTFIVDGTEWRTDPTAVSQVDDGFGRVNSVVIVSPEGVT